MTGGEKVGDGLAEDDSSAMPREQRGRPVPAYGAKSREFHALLKKLDPNGKYGNLVRVVNKRKEFLWVHENFASEY
ncbi:MAG: hypothetical protein ACOYYJ_19265 [Chloroflexota bacterium]